MRKRTRSELSTAELYRVAPNSMEFFQRIQSNSDLRDAAEKIVRKSIIKSLKKTRFNSHSEAVAAYDLTAMGMKVAFETVRIFIHEKGTSVFPDLWPGTQDKNGNLLAVEVHGFEWKVRKQKLSEKEAYNTTNFYVDKMRRLKEIYPQIDLLVVSDTKKEVMKNKYGIDVESFCKGYLYLPNYYEMPMEFGPLFKRFCLDQGIKAVERPETWIESLTEIVRKSLETDRKVYNQLRREKAIADSQRQILI